MFFPHMAAHAASAKASDPFCKYDDHMLQLFTSSLFLAAAIAAMFGSWTCNKYGRKATMVAGGLAFLVGTALVAGAVHIAMLVLGRIVLGIGVGFACQATPLYLSEMAPHNARGSLNIMFQVRMRALLLHACMHGG
jgi:MFS family permease